MAIPTAFDHKLAEVENAASSVSLALRTMQHAGAADLPRLRAGLRDRLAEFVNLAMSTARHE
jgi:hypothetical protein